MIQSFRDLTVWHKALTLAEHVYSASEGMPRNEAFGLTLQLRRAAVSIWWGLVSVGLIVAGFVARRPLARHSGLALLVLATGKACVFDLAEMPQTWRIASFVGLGLLMLGVAVGYARAAALLRGGPASTANPSM